MRDALSAAQQWGGVRPTALLVPGTPSTGAWSEADSFLAIAWSLDRAALCPGGCGHYLDETSEDDGVHEVHRVVCGACSARDHDQLERKNEEPVPGELAYVVRVADDED